MLPASVVGKQLGISDCDVHDSVLIRNGFAKGYQRGKKGTTSVKHDVEQYGS